MQLPFPHPVRTVWKLLALLRRDNPDITNGECAKQLGYNANSIGAWLRSPLYQSYENWLIEQTYDSQSLAVKVSRADVKEELDEFAVEMLGRLRDIVEHSSDEKLIASIGFDALDRAGYAEPKRDAQRPIQLILTSEVLSALMQRSREIADTTDVVVGEVLQSESVA
jgi:hypothetical protein